MLKRIFALSDGGAKDLKKGIAATAIYNILLMVPVGIMMMLVLEMLTGIDTGVFKATMFLDPTVGLDVCFEATMVMVIAGTIAGLIPAYKASRIRPIEALRAE